MQDPASTPMGNDVLGHLTRDYRLLGSVHDELMTPDGRVRAHWRPLLAALGAFHTSELQHRFGFADRHLRDSGIVHRIYDTGGGAERLLPMSHIPLIVDPDEWETIAAATRQRAALLDRVIGDIYGEQTLVRDNLLPAAALAGNVELLRPLVGAETPAGDHLRFYAMDIGRGPDGQWWVLGDRTQAPSGAGYLLENRIALSRALPELYRRLNVRRLASFFRSFRQSLHDLSRTPGNRVGLLTPGTYNETYFEHAYLARYLGFLLLQGEDLVVREGRLFVRTITGLQAIDVLLRRLDSGFADPMELDSTSRIGVPGLVEAVRSGNVSIVNALGSGVVEAPVMLSFLPAIAEALLGEDLILPHVATWWCGDDNVRAKVMPELDRRVVAPAFGGTIPGILENGPQPMDGLNADVRERIRESIAARGMDYVVQEAVELSTTPVWDGQGLAPRPFVLRVFATMTTNGWEVMPGGFCRISNALDARAVALQQGGLVADVWVPSDEPVEEFSLLAPGLDTIIKRQSDLLPATTAENLYWLGRYMDRAEACARLVQALAARLIEYNANEDGVIGEIADLLLDIAAQPRPKPAKGKAGKPAPDDAPVLPIRIDGHFAIRALFDMAAPGSVAHLAMSAYRAGSVIRERLSPEAWRTLRDLRDLANETPPANAGEAEAVQHCNQLLRLMASFSGLAHNNMLRSAGWRFLQLGFRIERAIGTAQAVRHLGAADRTPGAFEALLGILDSRITFGTRYANVPLRSQVIDLLVLDQLNPRSLSFQTGRIEEHIQFLASLRNSETPSLSEKIAISLAASLKTMDALEVDDTHLGGAVSEISGLADAIAADFFSHHRPAAEVLLFS